MIYLLLFYEFFKIGLFAVGGGLATIPFLYDLTMKYTWFTSEMLTNMIAISEATPGAIGINMATYVGYISSNSIFGGITTTIALIAPSIIIICMIAKFLEAFKTNKYVTWVFYGLRASVCALVSIAALTIFESALFTNQQIDLTHVVLFVIGLFITFKFKKIHPIIIIISGAIIGILLQL